MSTGEGRQRTRLEPELRRQLILDAAERVLVEHEPDDMTFEDVAEAAGVSRALVYNYFGDRSGLLAAVYVRSFERLDQELLGGLDDSLAPADQVRVVARGYLRFARSNPGVWRVLSAPGARHHPAVQEARGRRADRLAAQWGDTIEARLVARAVTGMLEAVTDDWVEHGGDADLVVDTLSDLLAQGLPALAFGGVAGAG